MNIYSELGGEPLAQISPVFSVGVMCLVFYQALPPLSFSAWVSLCPLWRGGPQLECSATGQSASALCVLRHTKDMRQSAGEDWGRNSTAGGQGGWLPVVSGRAPLIYALPKPSLLRYYSERCLGFLEKCGCIGLGHQVAESGFHCTKLSEDDVKECVVAGVNFDFFFSSGDHLPCTVCQVPSETDLTSAFFQCLSLFLSFLCCF